MVGRYGNRIAKGTFKLNDKSYHLATNNGENHLHGGVKGFNNVVWDVVQKSDSIIEFSRISRDMEEGYPGNLNVKVKYTLNQSNALKIEYTAITDMPTVVNLTHHSFFNLNGAGNGNINDHILQINASKFTPIDKGLIPTGELMEVRGTPFDFRKPKPIGQDLEISNQQLEFGMGYDHNFVLNQEVDNKEGLLFAAKVIDPKSGRSMKIYTNEPGLQFYGGNFLNGKDIGKDHKPYMYRSAFCLETQHFPNSPNQPNFPSTTLNPGEEYYSVCVYQFGIEK